VPSTIEKKIKKFVLQNNRYARALMVWRNVSNDETGVGREVCAATTVIHIERRQGQLLGTRHNQETMIIDMVQYRLTYYYYLATNGVGA
jgi:hypothetical protein